MSRKIGTHTHKQTNKHSNTHIHTKNTNTQSINYSINRIIKVTLIIPYTSLMFTGLEKVRLLNHKLPSHITRPVVSRSPVTSNLQVVNAVTAVPA